jgi:plastocyanin
VRRRLLRALPAAAFAGLAGCSGGSGGDGGGDAPTATAPSTETASPSPTDTPAPTPTASSTRSPEPTDSPTRTATPEPAATPTPTPGAELTVAVGPDGQLVFEPETFEIDAGETVRWEWESPGHNVSPERRPSEADWPGDDESTYGSGRTYAYTFTVPGRYGYHCDPHQSVGMTGSFAVR